MKPSEVRLRVLADHSVLREVLSRIEGLASCVLAGEVRLAQKLEQQVEELVGILESHLALEEELLLPALREADAWGEVRARRLSEAHEAQRAGLERLRALEERLDQAEFTRAVMAMAFTLSDDMRQEEHDILRAEVLRDDVVAIDTQVS